MHNFNNIFGLCSQLSKKIAYNCFYFLTCVLGAQKNRFDEPAFLSTHKICFGCRIRKIFFQFRPLILGPGFVDRLGW